MRTTDNVITSGMIAFDMVKSGIIKGIVDLIFVRVNKSTALHILGNQWHHGRSLYIGNNFGADLAMPLSNTDHWNLVRALSRTALIIASPLATVISLINFNHIRKYASVLIKKHTNLPKHTPSGLICHAMLTLERLCGEAGAGSRHLVDSVKPYMKRSGRLTEDGIGKWGYLLAAIITLINGLLSQLVVLRDLIAYWTVYAIRPKVIFNPFKASIIVWKMYGKILRCEVLHSILFHGFYPSLEYSIAQELRDVKG
ncbi:MAG: hypothetical protein WB588_12150 [Dehalococcoidia bacterium]